MNSLTHRLSAASLLLVGLASSTNPPRQPEVRLALQNPREPKIAFSSKRDAHYQLYVIDASGQRQTRLTTSAFQDRFPIWSPDGTKIAFGSQRGPEVALTIRAPTRGGKPKV